MCSLHPSYNNKNTLYLKKITEKLICLIFLTYFSTEVQLKGSVQITKNPVRF